MRILLDTHTLVWTQDSTSALGPGAREMLCNPENELLLSVISVLEISRLLWGGRLSLAGNLDEWLTLSLRSLACSEVVIDRRIARLAYELPEPFHLDPADRIVVATAIACKATVLTADERILGYAHVSSHDCRL